MALVRAVVDEHVRWADSVAAALPAQSRGEIHRLCRLLTERAADGPLRVGVFGQFSSGKSTLLNALLGARLLPSAARVTTGIATRIWPADTDVLAVTLRETGRVLDFGTSEFSAWYRSVADSVPSDIREVLREIMRSPRAARDLDGIDIGLTWAALGPGVVVVDTPGFDAAAAGHHEVAKRVAGDVDLAIVLIPASEPGAVSLGLFLHEVLGDLRDRCVFVLTKFRQVPEEERAEVQEHIACWLAGQGFPQAAVIRADATDIAVAARDGRPAADDGEIPAQAALGETRDIAGRLRALAAGRRQHLIEATLEVLMARLLSDVTAVVTERRAALETMRGHLDGVQIVDLAEFLRQWRAGLAGEIPWSAWRAVTRERSAAGPEEELSRARDLAVEQIRARSDITATVAELLRNTEVILGAWIARTLHRAMNSAAEDLARHAASLQAAFVSQYAGLAQVIGADPRPPHFERTLPPVPFPAVDLSAAFEPVRRAGSRLRSTARWKKRGGALAGAALGTAIAPGAGTVIGGALGLLAGSGHRTGTDRFRLAAEATHGDSLTAARDAIWRSAPALATALGEAASALAARYLSFAGPVVERLTAEYHAQVAGLDAELREVLGIMADADRRHRALARHGMRGA